VKNLEKKSDLHKKNAEKYKHEADTTRREANEVITKLGRQTVLLEEFKTTLYRRDQVAAEDLLQCQRKHYFVEAVLGMVALVLLSVCIFRPGTPGGL